jgi:hypothetical protein
MSDYAVDEGAPTGAPSDIPTDPQTDLQAPDDGVDLAQYTIFVPVRNNEGKEIPHLLDHVRQTLTQAGFQGRTVIRKAQGDWSGDNHSYDTEEMDLVMVDAGDDPDTLQAIKTVAEGIKQIAGQEAVYITKRPIKTYLV